MGRRRVPFQIEAEWIEYKIAFDDIYTKLNAALARQAKLQKGLMKQIVAQEEDPQQTELELDPKAAVRRKAANHASALRENRNPGSAAAAHLSLLSNGDEDP